MADIDYIPLKAQSFLQIGQSHCSISALVCLPRRTCSNLERRALRQARAVRLGQQRPREDQTAARRVNRRHFFAFYSQCKSIKNLHRINLLQLRFNRISNASRYVIKLLNPSTNEVIKGTTATFADAELQDRNNVAVTVGNLESETEYISNFDVFFETATADSVLRNTPVSFQRMVSTSSMVIEDPSLDEIFRPSGFTTAFPLFGDVTGTQNMMIFDITTDSFVFNPEPTTAPFFNPNPQTTDALFFNPNPQTTDSIFFNPQTTDSLFFNINPQTTDSLVFDPDFIDGFGSTASPELLGSTPNSFLNFDFTIDPSLFLETTSSSFPFSFFGFTTPLPGIFDELTTVGDIFDQINATEQVKKRSCLVDSFCMSVCKNVLLNDLARNNNEICCCKIYNIYVMNF